MSIPSFLRNRPPLPNPAGHWEVRCRRAEGGAWELLARRQGEGLARDEVEARAYGVGDLVALHAPAGRLRALWVATPDGLEDAGRVPDGLQPRGIDWVEAWEGKEAEAHQMLWLANAVDPRRLALAAAGCAETVLGATRDPRPEAAIAAARAWAAGEIDAAACDAAGVAAMDASRAAEWERPTYAAAAAAAAAFVAKWVVRTPTRRDSPWSAPVDDPASNAAMQAAYARSFTRDGRFYEADARAHALRDLTRRVRAYVPLPVILLARANVATPLSLGF